MPWYLFPWDAETEEHFAEHGVTPDEFEAIVCHPDTVGESRSTGRPIAFGYAGSGRYLACVYELIDRDTVLPVTPTKSKIDGHYRGSHAAG